MTNESVPEEWNPFQTHRSVKIYWKVSPSNSEGFNWEETNSQKSSKNRKIHIAEVNGRWENREVSEYTPIVKKWDADGEIAHPIYYYHLLNSHVKNLKSVRYRNAIEKAISTASKSRIALRDVRWKYKS